MTDQKAKKKKALDLDQSIIWDTLVKLATLVFLLGDEALAAAIFLFSVCLKEQGPEETLKDLNSDDEEEFLFAQIVHLMIAGLGHIEANNNGHVALSLYGMAGLVQGEDQTLARAIIIMAGGVNNEFLASEDIISMLSAGDASMTVDHILKAAQLKAPDLEEQLVSAETGLVDPAGRKLN